MAYIIPNATDTGAGNKYYALDQAEPDALDFEVLGSRASGVISGCEVRALTVPSTAVSVDAGYVVLANNAYPVTANPNLSLGAGPTNNRFDLVVVRIATGASTGVLTVLSGTDSATNPTFPLSNSRYTGASTLSYFEPSTDVLLAAIYRSGSLAVTSSMIVDKRSTSTSSIRLKGGTPATDMGSDGDLYFKNTLVTGDSSGVYVKRNSAWQELAKAPIDPGVPIGTIIMWPSSLVSPSNTVWIEADGTAVSRVAYKSLFDVVSTTYGVGDGSTTFNLPDFRGHFLSGLPASGRSMGTRYGAASNNVSLTVANVPSHNHALSTGVTVSSHDGHTHAIDHDHSSTNSGPTNDTHTHPFTATTDPQTVVTYQGLAFNHGSAWGYMTTTDLLSNTPNTAFNLSHTHTVSGTTGAGGAGHSHSIDLPAFTGTSSTAGGHAHTVSGTTESTGSTSPVSVEPSNYPIRYFIRYA